MLDTRYKHEHRVSRIENPEQMSKSLTRFAAAALIYVGFAVYLYQPYFKYFNALQYLLVVNVSLASLGCFALSRRWVASFWGSLFAGAIYGFGPFMLGLAKYHPTAGFLTASIPWLFCPAALWSKARRRWLSVPLSLLPFLAIALFFQVSTYFRLFAVPIQTKMRLSDLAGLLAPLVMAQRNINAASVGFYHIPTAALLIGFSMLLAARRLGIIAIFAIGTVLAFANPLLEISPIIWLSIPVLCCSVIIGAGIQALACAGSADRKWVLAATAIMAALSIATLLLAARYFQIIFGLGKDYAQLFISAAYMYILGTITLAIMFFVARARLRLHWLRLAIFCSAMAVDISFGARFIVDSIL
jgi:hypothetical protein